MAYGTLKVDTIQTSTQTVSVDEVLTNALVAGKTVNAGTGLLGGGAINTDPTIQVDPDWVNDQILAEEIEWVSASAAFSAAANTKYLVNTSTASFTVTLPATPAAGQFVVLADAAGSFAANNLLVAGGGSNIVGAVDDLICDVNNAVIRLVYSGNATTGWLIK